MSSFDLYATAPVEPEARVAVLHRHARILTLPALVLIACCGAAGYFGGRLAPAFLGIWTAPALIGFGVLVFAAGLVAWRSRRYVVTTRRLIIQVGYLIRRRQEVTHAHGTALVLTQNPIQRMFRSGTITVDFGSPNPVKLVDLPRAVLVYRGLQELIDSSPVRGWHDLALASDLDESNLRGRGR